jgi:hypothetical protein
MGGEMSDTPRTDVAEHNMGSVVEPHYVVDVEVAHDLERELAEARGQREKLVEALNSIREYWNQGRNDDAMFDACWYAINTADTVLKECEK